MNSDIAKWDAERITTLRAASAGWVSDKTDGSLILRLADERDKYKCAYETIDAALEQVIEARKQTIVRAVSA